MTVSGVRGEAVSGVVEPVAVPVVSGGGGSIPLGPDSFPAPFSVSIPLYAHLAERFTPHNEEDGAATFSLCGRRVKRKILTVSPSPQAVKRASGGMDRDDGVEGDNEFTLEGEAASSEVEFVSEDVANRTLDGASRNRRPAKVRKTKGSPRLVLRPCPGDEDYLKLPNWTNEEIRSYAVGWLDDVEAIRKRSVNINGGLSGKIRSRIRFLRSIVNALAERAEDQGSAAFNRARNEELERQLKSGADG